MSQNPKSNRFDRRDFLRASAYGAGLSLLPASIQRALALPANVVNANLSDVGHVVILMQENRSFDHYFGTLAGVRGFGDRFTIPRYNGESMLVQRSATRTVLPYYLDSSQGNGLGVGNPHGWSDAQAAWNHGRMNQWPVSKSDFSMGYLKTTDLPFHTALANAFTVCDHYHCALHGGTNSNRIHLWTGTNRGTTARSNGTDMCVINNDGWDTVDGTPLANSLTWTTYPERLQQAGVSWKVYQFLPDNYTDNSLSGFKNYRDAFSRVNNGNTASYSSATSVPAVEYSAALHDTPGLPTYEPLYKGIGRTEPTYPDTLAMFRADALSDTLPAVSWIVGPAMYTEHPDYTPAQGAYFISQVLDALTANPTVWGKTVLFVNYDENDGYFDHIPPPCAPSPNGAGSFAGKSTVDTARDYMNVPNATNLDAGDGRPFGPGPRVPMFVISPWSRGGYLNSQVHDHTSIIRFLENRFGVMEPNISPWRRAVMGDFSSAFDFVNPNADTSFIAGLPLADPVTAELQYLQQSSGTAVAPPAETAQSLPVQAQGTRPARALPYELNVAASLDAATGAVTLGFANTGTAAAVFHVYDRYHLADIPRRYTVEAGKSISDVWTADPATGLYDLWVLGPNGFHRLFRGSAGSAPFEATSRYDRSASLLTLTLKNAAASAATFTVTPAAHRNDPPVDVLVPGAGTRELAFALGAQMNWYDFTLRAPGGLTRRLAGHLENGKTSVSDPAMAAAEVAAAFAFADQTGVPTSTAVVSDAVALSGFPGYLPVSASPGTEFSIDGGPFVTSAPAVCTGQTLTLRQLSAAAFSTATVSAVTVGTTTGLFKSVTAAQATTTPDPSPAPTPAPTPTPSAPINTPIVTTGTPASSSGRLDGGGSADLAGLAALALAAAARAAQGTAAKPEAEPIEND